MLKVEIKPVRSTHRSVQRKIRQIARKIGDTRRANYKVSVWLFRWVNENFRSEGGKVGGWKPFKYGGRRMKGGVIDRTANLLQDTGKMRASFKPFYTKSIAGIGSDLDRSVWHDAGVPQNNLPARQLLPKASDRDVGKSILKIYEVHVKRATR
jgi:phage gpG-like protein